MKTKIFFIDRFLTSSFHLFNSLESLEESEGIDFTFVGPKKDSHWLSYHKVKNSVEIWSKDEYISKIYNYIKKTKPNLVHFEFEWRTYGNLKSVIFFPYLLFLIKRLNVKIVITFQNILLSRKNNSLMLTDEISLPIPKFLLTIVAKIMIKSILHFADRIITQNEDAKKALNEFYNIKLSKIEAIQLGTSKLKELNIKKLNEYEKKFENKKIILIFGIISPRKGQEVAIKAFKIIEKTIPNAILVIVGRPATNSKEYLKYLETLVNKLNLNEKVVFTGFVVDDEVQILFKMAKIALYVYSPIVGSAHAQFFAIEHKIPCVATDCETFKEVLGEDGAMYVQSENESMVAESMKILLEQQGVVNKIKEKMSIVDKEFTWENAAKKHLQLYKDILKD